MMVSPYTLFFVKKLRPFQSSSSRKSWPLLAIVSSPLSPSRLPTSFVQYFFCKFIRDPGGLPPPTPYWRHWKYFSRGQSQCRQNSITCMVYRNVFTPIKVTAISDTRPSFSAFCVGDAQTQTHRHTRTHTCRLRLYSLCVCVCVRDRRKIW